MKIEARPSGITAVTFDGSLETESTRRAFEEHNEHRTDRGNSVSDFDKWVESWRGYVFHYTCKCYSLQPLIEPLEYFIENTETKVDELLDTRSEITRIFAAANRYRLMDVAYRNLEILIDYIGEGDTALAIY